jgi:hypothetical protein
MSYDLYFTSEALTLTEKQFTAYFSKRDCYTVNGGQAFYENEDTGVYFYFDYESDNPGMVAFNLNYFRPHFFGLEAAPEVAAFVTKFGLSIEDPQTDGMGDGPFTIDGFLRGWNAGNRFGYKAILSPEDRPDTHVCPTRELERIWKWNFNRKSLQGLAGDDVFVPIIMFTKSGMQTKASVVWPDACPTYIPKVDLVFVIRDELSSNRSADDPYETTIAEWADIRPVIEEYPFDEKLGCYRLEFKSTPASLSDFVRSIPLVPHNRHTGIPYDSVLNAEMVYEFTKSSEQ